MYTISKTFIDYSRTNGKLNINLSPDKPLHPSTFTAPITWTGFIGGQPVIIIQNVSDPLSLDDFEFVEYPEKYEDYKGYVPEWIDEALRIMD